MDRTEFHTSLPIPVYKLKTKLTYTEVEKPSGLMYMLMVLFSELSSDEARLSDTLVEIGVSRSLHSMMADVLKALLENEVVQINGMKTFSKSSFETYKVNDFTMTSYGNDLLRKKLMPTNQEMYFVKDIYYSVPEESFTLSDDEMQDFMSMLPKTLYNNPFPKGDELKHILMEFDNRSIDASLSKDAMLKAVELKKENISTIQQKKDIKLIVDQDGTMEVVFDNKRLDDFYKDNYSVALVKKLFREKKKFKFKEDVSLSQSEWKDLKSVRSLDFPENLSNTPSKRTLILGGSKNTTTEYAYNTETIKRKLQSIQKGLWAVYWTDDALWLRSTVTLKLIDKLKEKPIDLEWVVDITPDDSTKEKIYKLLETSLVQDYNNNFAWKIAKRADELSKSDRFVTRLFYTYDHKSNFDSLVEWLKTHSEQLKGYSKVRSEIDKKTDSLIKGLGPTNRDESFDKLYKLLPFGSRNQKSLAEAIVETNHPEKEEDILDFFASMSSHGLASASVFNDLDIASIMMEHIADGKPMMEPTFKKAQPFMIFKRKHDRLKAICAMKSPHDYRIPFENMDWKAFKEDYRLLKNAYSELKTHEKANKTAFNTLSLFMDAYSDIHDKLRIYHEVNTVRKMDHEAFNTLAVNHPDKFLLHFQQRMEKMLKQIFKIAPRQDYAFLLDQLAMENTVSKEDLDHLHRLRKLRNQYVHENKLDTIPEKTYRKSIDVLFELEERS